MFLSSGIIRSPDYTMEQVVAVARTLRVDHQFRGYIHLKTIPEASTELIEEAGHWADRISINIELPTVASLAQLAPEKNLARTRAALGAIRERINEAKSARTENRKAPAFAPAGQSTQHDRWRDRNFRRYYFGTSVFSVFRTQAASGLLFRLQPNPGRFE